MGPGSVSLRSSHHHSNEKYEDQVIPTLKNKRKTLDEEIEEYEK
jgi:hypothetical protein